MSAGTERLVGRFGTLADGTVPIVDFVTSVVLGQGLASDTLLIDPSVRIPDRGVLPDQGIHLGDTGRSEDKVTLGNDVRDVLFDGSGGRDRGRDGDVGHDLAHDRVNRSVLQGPSRCQRWHVSQVDIATHHPQGLPDARVKQGQVLQVFVGQIPKGTVGVAKLFLLLLVELLAAGLRVSTVISSRTSRHRHSLDVGSIGQVQEGP